jgi:hypothetical protein
VAAGTGGDLWDSAPDTAEVYDGRFQMPWGRYAYDIEAHLVSTSLGAGRSAGSQRRVRYRQVRDARPRRRWSAPHACS